MALQTSEFEKYLDLLLFNVGTDNPDKSIYPFLEKYVPVLLNMPEPGDGWSIYPDILLEQEQRIIHSFIFRQHPYFNEVFSEGILEIHTKEWGEYVGIEAFFLSLSFKNKKDADNAFRSLCDRFSILSTRQDIIKMGLSEKAEFTNENLNKSNNAVTIKLLDNNFNEGYKVVVKPWIDSED